MVRLSSVLAISILFLLLALPFAYADTEITACGQALDSDSRYFLAGDLSDSADTCLTVGADYITIDCQGNTIRRASGTGLVGISTSYSYTTITNCIVKNYSESILFSGASNGLIENTTVISTSSASTPGIGIYLTYSSGNILTNINASSDFGAALDLNAASGNTLTNITATTLGSDDISFLAYSISDCPNTLTNVTGTGGKPILYHASSPVNISNTDASVIVLCDASGSNITNSNATKGGLQVFYTENSTFSGITTTSTNNCGLYLSRSSRNIITNLNATSVNNGGAYLLNSRNNNITNSNFFSDLNNALLLHSDDPLVHPTSYNLLVGVNATSNEGIAFYIYCDLWQSCADHNTFVNSIATSVNGTAIYLTESSNTNLTNVNASSSNSDDLYFTTFTCEDCDPHVLPKCTNTFTNVKGTDGKPILYNANSPATISNTDASAIILCNASGSNITNSNATRGGIQVLFSNSSTFSNIIATSFSENALYLYYSPNTALANINASSVNGTGLWIDASSDNSISNVNASSAGTTAMQFVWSDHNNLTGIIVASLSGTGLSLSFCSGNNIYHATLSGYPAIELIYDSNGRFNDINVTSSYLSSTPLPAIASYSTSNFTLININVNSTYNSAFNLDQGSSNITLINITAASAADAIDFIFGSSKICNYTLANFTGSGGKRILLYANSPATISDTDASAIILCNATGSSVTNSNATNGGLQVYFTENSTFSGITATSLQGPSIYLYGSSRNRITNAISTSISNYAILLASSSSINITNSALSAGFSGCNNTANECYAAFNASGGSGNIFLHNNITADFWVDTDESDLILNDSTSGNYYRLFNGTSASSFCDITSGTNTWADGGGARPLQNGLSCLASDYGSRWPGSEGADWHPYVGQVADPNSVSICRYLSSPNTVYTLSQSINSHGHHPCLTVMAENVTLDCNGYKINGHGDGKGIYSNYSGTRVLNCDLRNFSSGGGYSIEFENSRNNRIENTYADDGEDGIVFNSVNDSYIINTTSIGIDGSGIYLSSSSDNILENSTALSQNSGDAVVIYNSPRINMTHCTLTASGSYIALNMYDDGGDLRSDNGTFVRNTFIATDSGSVAVALEGGSVGGNIFLNNIFRSDTWVISGSPDANYFNDSEVGNRYYFANGTGASILYDISSSTSGSYWADQGTDLPFGEAVLGSGVWHSDDVDRHPYVSHPNVFANGSDIIVSGSATNLSVVIGGTSDVNNSEQIGVQTVAIAASGLPIVEFSYDFTDSTLNLSGLAIETGVDADGKAYASISGINTSNVIGGKTIHMYDANPEVDSVCVKDEASAVHLSISPTCTESDEYVVPCDGATYSGYTCTFDGTTAIITGLQRSAIIQFYYINSVSEPAARSTGGGSLKSVSLGKSFDCNTGKLEVTATSSRAGVPGLAIHLFRRADFSVSESTTDSTGKAVFTITKDGAYDIYTYKTGAYSPTALSVIELDLCQQQANPPVTTPPATPPSSSPPETPPTQNNPALQPNTPPAAPANEDLTKEQAKEKDDAQAAIAAANSAISTAAGKDTSAAADKLDAAIAAFNAGDFAQAKQLAQEANSLALNSKSAVQKPKENASTTQQPINSTSTSESNSSEQNGFNWSPVLGGTLVALFILAAAYYVLNRRKN
ncbi:Right handed beta helix region [Candidatus Gugararchaeum adminiculabundum]|nr:Right handed beta helix region [Candidatus Gugararchaeum adminiculabundum]